MSPDGSRLVPPEEKLLRLIRGKKSPSGAPSSSSGGRAAETQVSPALPVPPRAFRKNAWFPGWWLIMINVTLGIVVVGEVVALGWLMKRPEADVSTAELPTNQSHGASGSTGTEGSGQTGDPMQAIDSLASAASRPLFQQERSPEVSEPRATPRVMTEQAKTLATRLSLIGVVDGDPVQAIIEDSQTQKTYFVTVGQPVVEGLQVVEIRPNRVILELNGERIELAL